jgi:amino acid transporter
MAVTIENNSGIIVENSSQKPRRTWRNVLFGNPLATSDAHSQAIGKLVGLAVFSSDALSSVAYSTQEMLLILAVAGTSAFTYSLPLTLGIIVLLGILTLSYEQTIHAYPGGGGAYIVARDNLGELPAQTAGAALLTDYILTVAVSTSSGVAQIVSAYPSLFPYRVWIAVAMVLFVMIVNLRGVKESGITFAIPTYFFLVMMYLTVGVGLFRFITGSLGTVPNPPIEALTALQPITFFLVLKAFANGTTALTGVEAISNGIMAFKEPRSKNAGITLVWMSLILGSLLMGVAFLAHSIAAVPAEGETIISQIGRTALGTRGFLYLALIASTTVILMMAANTAFADFPRLSALQAGDGFLPRQLTLRGSRLVFSRGIIALTVISCGLIVIFQASVSKLIPLYAIGVFLSFTLSQGGMARRWHKSGQLKPGEELVEQGSTLRFDKNWKTKMVINAVGSFTTLCVMIIFAITKFKDGAWVVVLLTPILVAIFSIIHKHYKDLARQLSLDNARGSIHQIVRHRVIMPVSGVHNGTLVAIRYAKTLSDDITAVHICTDPAQAEKIKKKWEIWGDGIRLVILDSPYRELMDPLLDYVMKIEKICQPNEVITLIVPQFIPKHRWTTVLHEHTADLLRKTLINQPNIVVTEVPYQVD